MSVTAVTTNTPTKQKFSCFACLGKKRPPSAVYNFSPAGAENGNNDVINDNGNFDDDGIVEEV